MTVFREVRADYDRSSIVVYQAYQDAIADAALKSMLRNGSRKSWT